MKVLHINSYYQTGVFYKNLFDRQVALGDEIDVYTPVPKGFSAPGRDFGSYAFVDANHRRADRLFFHLKQYKMLRGALARYAPVGYGLLHAHSLLTNGGVAYNIHRRFGVPYIVAVRDTDVNVLMRRMPHLRPLARRILESAARVIFLSESYRERALTPYLSSEEMARVKAKSAVVPNGIDELWLRNPPMPRAHPNAEEVRLLFVGQLVARKNLPAAIAVAQMLADRGRKVRLTVVGQPIDRVVVEAARASKLVELLPPRPMAELMPLYRAADVFLLPSGRETFGLVYAEALSQGLPGLYTRGQGFDGQFPDGEVGFAIDPNDPNDTVSAVERILKEYASFSAAAVQGSKKFDWNAIAQTYQTLYGEVTR